MLMTELSPYLTEHMREAEVQELKEKIALLEAENKRLKESVSNAGWRESKHRAEMASKYGGEDW